jgi:hypothetical protein
MKRLLITAVLAISMIALLAACSSESTEAEPSNQETTSGSTGIEPVETGTFDWIVDSDANVQIYLSLMDDLANALNTDDLSANSLDEITAITSRLETFAGFFNGLDEAGRNYLFGKYGVELRQTAERVASYAITTQEQRGDEAISQLLAPLPAFAAVTSTTDRAGRNGSVLPLELVTGLAGYIGSLLLPGEVAALAGGVELTTNYLDQESISSKVEHRDWLDWMSFATADGSQSFNLTTVKYDSEEAATNHLELVTSEKPGMQEHTSKIGDTSFFAEVNEFGIGSTVAFKKGLWAVMLHTTQSADATPLVDLAGVEALARTVADRL